MTFLIGNFGLPINRLRESTAEISCVYVSLKALPADPVIGCTAPGESSD